MWNYKEKPLVRSSDGVKIPGMAEQNSNYGCYTYVFSRSSCGWKEFFFNAEFGTTDRFVAWFAVEHRDVGKKNVLFLFLFAPFTTSPVNLWVLDCLAGSYWGVSMHWHDVSHYYPGEVAKSKQELLNQRLGRRLGAGAGLRPPTHETQN